MINAKDAVLAALENKTIIPAFNVSYLPMAKPITQAIVDEDSVGMIQVARLEWEKFGSESLEAVAEEYKKYENPRHTLLHLDHIPAIDEDLLEVDYMHYLNRGIKAGYQSVMVDASRLDLQGNIDVTKAAAKLAHAANVPCEAELGAVMGHESGPTIPYEDMFKTRQGFTDLDEAARFVSETKCDWLSVAVGNIHGAIADGLKFQKKPEARLDIEHIGSLRDATGVPLVLHGGSGINKEYILQGICAGISKINVGTEIRQAYSRELEKNPEDVGKAQDAVYKTVRDLIKNFLCISGTRALLFG